MIDSGRDKRPRLTAMKRKRNGFLLRYWSVYATFAKNFMAERIESAVREADKNVSRKRSVEPDRNLNALFAFCIP